jgi:hypothetical protein
MLATIAAIGSCYEHAARVDCARGTLFKGHGWLTLDRHSTQNPLNQRFGLLTAAIGIQLVILTPKFRLEVFIASPRFEDFDVSAGVCGSSSLPGAG